MKLIDSLAAGIRGAEVGSVLLLRRGTSTNATYYLDFESQQQYSTSPIALDSDGAVVLYVNELVDVQVYDSVGVLVREFVAGENATSVEVISQSFTGVDYEDGSSGANKPTTLATVLDLWKTSAGAIDFKVLFNGVPMNLQNAFSATFFNVRSYGALGTGVADDRTAILAAQAAATAAGGGVVFFPPGNYRITNSIPLAANVWWLGSGGLSTKVSIDSAVSAGVLTLPGNGVTATSNVSNIWLGAINGVAPGPMVSYTALSSGNFNFTDCALGVDIYAINTLYAGVGGTSSLKTTFTRCLFRLTTVAAQLIISDGTARLTLRDCDLVNTNATGIQMVDCDGPGVFEGNRFDWSAATIGPGIQYIRMSPTAPSVIVGNTFAANTAVPCAAIHNQLAAPIIDCQEYGNVFGNMTAANPGCTPYSYTTDGYVSLAAAKRVTAGHQTRYSRQESYTAAAANQAVDPKAFGTTIINRTAGGNITVDANRGSMGDRWTLELVNNTGGAITVIGGTNIIFDPAVAPLPVANNGFAQVQLAWLTTFGGVGVWYQVGKAVLL